MLKYTPDGMQTAVAQLERCQSVLLEAETQVNRIRSVLSDMRGLEVELEAVRWVTRKIVANSDRLGRLKNKLQECDAAYHRVEDANSFSSGDCEDFPFALVGEQPWSLPDISDIELS